ncbi:MAG: phosphopantothenoylcysteine decarboxylase [Planctomycetota bacterium]
MSPRPPTILISAGPSREYFDDVRFLSNASSGAMGIEVARAAVSRGARAVLALGPVALAPPAGVEVHSFVSALELDAITKRLWPEVDAFVATAAVCDYRPSTRLAGKRKKTGDEWIETLTPNPDVLALRSEEKGARVLVGFALEADPRRDEAERKLRAKRLDVIILNSTQNLGSRAGRFEWIEAGGRSEEFENITKSALAEKIVAYILSRIAVARR